MRAINLTCNTSRLRKCTGGGVVLWRCVWMRGFFLWFKGPISSREQRPHRRAKPPREGNDLTLSYWILPRQILCTITPHFTAPQAGFCASISHKTTAFLMSSMLLLTSWRVTEYIYSEYCTWEHILGACTLFSRLHYSSNCNIVLFTPQHFWIRKI